MMHPIPVLLALLAGALSQPLWAAEFPAVLGWADRTALSLPVSGTVEAVHVRAGQEVEAGATLITLDPRPFEARLHEARAGVQALERKRAEAAREVERAKELYARTVLSTVELEQAYIQQQQVDGEYLKARARLELAEIERDDSRLQAPFAARVLRVHTAVGASLSAAMQPPALVELARAQIMDAYTTLTPEQAMGLHPGGKAQVEVNGHRMAGEILALESLPDGSYRLVVRVQAGEDWLAGLPAKIFTP